MYKLLAHAANRLLFAIPTNDEYGPELRKRIAPLITGVGPVESGIAIAAVLGAHAAHGDLPDLVILLGSAGSATLDHLELYQAISVSYRDMDATAIGFEAGCTPFLDLPAVLELPLRIPGLKTARASSGGAIVNGAAYHALDAEMADMETYSILRACQHFGVPMVCVRGISDGKAQLAEFTDWSRALGILDIKLSAAVDRLLEDMIDGRFALARPAQSRDGAATIARPSPPEAVFLGVQ